MDKLKPCFCGNTDPQEFIIKKNRITCLECHTSRVSSTSTSEEDMVKVWNVRGLTPLDDSDASASNLSSERWDDYLNLILSIYSKTPDEHTLSVGDWKHTGIGLPDFRGAIQMKMGSLRKLAQQQLKEND
jgi:hypothetical protein